MTLKGYSVPLLFEAALELIKWHLIIRWRAFAHWKQHLSENLPEDRSANADQSLSSQYAIYLNQHIASIVRHSPLHLNCMRRSMALKSMLNRRKTAAQLHIGVRFTQQKQLKAHAWLSLNGKVINDDQSNLEQYTEITRDRESIIQSHTL